MKIIFSKWQVFWENYPLELPTTICGYKKKKIKLASKLQFQVEQNLGSLDV